VTFKYNNIQGKKQTIVKKCGPLTYSGCLLGGEGGKELLESLVQVSDKGG
jgi:hypothetical protein